LYLLGSESWGLGKDWIYLGLSYINYHLPTRIGGGSVTAFDDDLEINYYGAYFGMSSFNGLLYKLKMKEEKGIKFFLDQNMSAGVGINAISDEGKRRMRFAEVMTMKSLPVDIGGDVTIGVTYQLTAGLLGGATFGRVFLGLGAGYDGFVQLYGDHSLIRHGAVIKTYISF
jgi:hypothetical protein